MEFEEHCAKSFVAKSGSQATPESKSIHAIPVHAILCKVPRSGPANKKPAKRRNPTNFQKSEKVHPNPSMHHVPHNNGWVRVSATRWRGVWCGEWVSTRVVQKKKKLHIWAHLKDRREEKSETRKMETSSNKTKYLKNSTEKPRKQKKMWRSCFLCLCGYLSSSQFFPIQCISERATKRKYFYPFTKRTTRLEGSCRENTKRSLFLDRMDVSRLLGSTWSGPVQHHVMCPHCKANGTTEGVGVRMRGRLSKLISEWKRVREKIRESD